MSQVKVGKLFRAKITHPQIKERNIYVVAASMIDAANKLVDALTIDEELVDIIMISEECYV